jgi:hypothetical protein
MPAAGADRIRSKQRRRHASLLLRAAAGLAVCLLAGCNALATKHTGADLAPWPEIRPDARMEVLRARMHEYSITFAAEVDVAAAGIERRTSDAAIRRNAVLWRVRAIPEMRKACFRLEPVSGLVDAWILARQMDQLFSDGAGAGAFGPFQSEAVAVSHGLLEQMRTIGASIAVSPQTRTEFERKFIDPWLVDHPLQDMTFVRQSPIARFAEQARESGQGLESVGTMEELAVTLAQQARIYLADLPRQVHGEVDLLRSDMLPEERVASLQSDLHTGAAAADRIAGAAEGITPLVLSERPIILEELSRQRGLLMDALSVEGDRTVDAMVRAMAAERGELLRNVEAQRQATLAWATSERREAIADLHREVAASLEMLRGERAVVVDNVRRIVDAVLLRIALFIAAAVLLAPLVAHVYVRVWPRRPRDQADRVTSA